MGGEPPFVPAAEPFLNALIAPAAERNKKPIFDALATRLPSRANILELGSGTGTHAAYMTQHSPGWTWQPSDRDVSALKHLAGPNIRPPLALDVTRRPWPVQGTFDAILAVNVLHVAPEAVAEAIFEQAPNHLTTMGRLYLYGPFFFDGQTEPSNRAFDQDLRFRDPSWGIRDTVWLSDRAMRAQLTLEEAVPLPANNHMLCFSRLMPA